MGKRYIFNEKENKNLSDEVLHHLERRANQSLHRRQELLLLQKIRTRMQQSRANMAKLRDNFHYMKRLIVNCVDMVDKTMELVERENQEAQEFSQQMAPSSSSDDSQRSKHTVNPMIAGLPLKRATIALRRVSADGIVHFHRTEGSFPSPVVSVEVPEDTMLAIEDEFDLASDIDSDEEFSSELSEI